MRNDRHFKRAARRILLPVFLLVAAVAVAYAAPKINVFSQGDRLSASLVNENFSNLAAAAVPTGAIMMWSGAISAIPEGWALCDGQNGTPDLRDRFVMGASQGENPGTTGGANSYQLTVSQLPGHTHSATTATAGSHSHTTGIKYASWAGSGGLYFKGDGAAAANIPIDDGGSHSHTVDVGSTGGGASIDNRPAYFKLAFIIKL